MAFGVPYQPGYMPNYYPMGQQMPSAMPDQLAQLRQAAYPQQQPTAQQTAPIIWVQGEEGSKAYMVAAGNSVLLMDSENSTFYIKSTDASGMPQPLRVFDYSERTASQKQPTHTAQKPKEEYIAIPTGGTVEAISASLAINGEPLNSATATVTPAAVENFFNIYIAAFVEVPRGCCVTIAVENSSTQAISVSNSNLIVERES